MKILETRKKRSLFRKLFLPIIGAGIVQIVVFSPIILSVSIPETGTKIALSLLLLFFFVLEAVCVYSITSIIKKPIRAITAELNQIDSVKKVHLQETGIIEIDELTRSIENMSISVADSASKLSKIIDMGQIPIGVFQYEEKSSEVFCSSTMVKMLGWDDSEHIDGYYSRNVFFGHLTSMEKYWYQDTGNTTIYKIPGEKENKWIQIFLARESQRTLGTVTDISKEMEEKIRIEFERDYDVLTGIFNRRAFDTALDNLFAFPSRIGIGAFVMLDLDNLKYVNDTYGHEAGDSYITTMANVLKDFEEFNGLISRRSGDEFTVFMHGYRSKEQVKEIIFSIFKKIEQQSIILPNKKPYTLMASAGIAYYPSDSTDVKQLTNYADFAMYLVKHSVKGNIQEFNLQDYNERSYLLNGHEALVRLLDRGELDYALQPIFDTVNGTIFGYEMLMRSNIPELSSPMEILSMAKSQSKLYQLERITWFNALKAFSEKVNAGKIDKSAKVFFNSFGSLMLQSDDMDDFKSRYEEYLSSIVLEIIGTEQHVIEYSDTKTKMITDFGGMIALDNFGSGYNNEALLVISSPHLLKVDINIINNIDVDSGKQQLLKNIILFANSRNIKIIAEGVETRSEMETLVSFGVDFLQGYYIGQPEMDVSPIDEKVIQEIKTARGKNS